MNKAVAISVALAAAGCTWQVGRARAVVPRNAPRHRLTIEREQAELHRNGPHLQVRLVAPAAPDPADISLSPACGMAFGPTAWRAERQGHAVEAIYDFDWPELAGADRLTLIVRRPDRELRFGWRFAE